MENTPRFEEPTSPQETKDEKYEKNKSEFLSSVFDPEEFQRVCDQIDHSGRMRKAEEYVGYWVNELRGDTTTMERIIETYMDGKHLGGFVLAKAIRAIEGKESDYFEGLYTRLSELENPEGYSGGYVPNIAHTLTEGKDPHDEFKMATLRNWHGKAAAIGRVTDQDFLRRTIDEVPDDCDFKYQSPQAIAVRNVEDVDYLQKVAGSKTDTFIREAAESRIKELQEKK